MCLTPTSIRHGLAAAEPAELSSRQTMRLNSMPHIPSCLTPRPVFQFEESHIQNAKGKASHCFCGILYLLQCVFIWVDAGTQATGQPG